MPSRRSRNVKSPGKGGVKHDIKKPATLKSIKKEKPNIVARLTSLRSSKRNILCEITNDESVVKIENIDEIVKEEPPKEVKSEVKHVTKKKKEAEEVTEEVVAVEDNEGDDDTLSEASFGEEEEDDMGLSADDLLSGGDSESFED